MYRDMKIAKVYIEYQIDCEFAEFPCGQLKTKYT